MGPRLLPSPAHRIRRRAHPPVVLVLIAPATDEVGGLGRATGLREGHPWINTRLQVIRGGAGTAQQAQRPRRTTRVGATRLWMSGRSGSRTTGVPDPKGLTPMMHTRPEETVNAARRVRACEAC